MSTVNGNSIRHMRAAPRWPVVLLGFCAVMATLSLAQGVVDLVIPAIRGEEPFGFLFTASERFGPGFLATYLFIHNLGLACIVPGVGFIAAWFERRTVNRTLIGWLLAGSVALSLLVALQYILQAPERFDMRIAVPIYVGESLAVIAVALAGALEMRGFVPTRRYEWALVTPFRRLWLVLASAAAILALLATLETYVLYMGLPA